MVQFSHSVISDCLWPQEVQHARIPCLSPSPGVGSNSCPLSWWCHPTISSSVIRQEQNRGMSWSWTSAWILVSGLPQSSHVTWSTLYTSLCLCFLFYSIPSPPLSICKVLSGSSVDTDLLPLKWQFLPLRKCGGLAPLLIWFFSLRLWTLKIKILKNTQSISC